MRSNFDHLVNKVGRRGITEEELESVVPAFLIFFRASKDQERLIWISKKILIDQKRISQLLQNLHHRWLYRICKLLHLNLNLLNESCNGNRPIATQLRILEVFTTESIYISLDSKTNMDDNSDSKQFAPESTSILRLSMVWRILIKSKLFSILRKLVDQRVPAPSESTINPPTELAQSLAELIRHALDWPSADHQSRCLLIGSFLGEFFAGPLSPQVDLFFAPYLAYHMPTNLRAMNLVSALKGPFPETIRLYTNGQEKILDSAMLDPSDKPSSESYQHLLWMCYSFLKLIHRNVARLREDDAHAYLLILKAFMVPITFFSELSFINQADDDNPEEEYFEDTTEISDAVWSYSRKRRDQSDSIDRAISKMIGLLSEPNHVDFLINLIAPAKEVDISARNNASLTQSFDAIIKICYLMLTHEHLAVFECRLLYTLAFRPTFLRHLWRYILTAASPCLFGNPTPVYSMLARGTNIGPEVWPLIVPHLSLFCSLFSYLLPTLDDDEFYEISKNDLLLELAAGKQRHNTNKPTIPMPFKVSSELVSICSTLRDICVGLVEITYQDQRPGYMRTADWSNQDIHTKLFSRRAEGLFRTIVRLVRQLHLRDSRRQFCPDGMYS